MCGGRPEYSTAGIILGLRSFALYRETQLRYSCLEIGGKKMTEQDYQNDLMRAEDGADEPKAAGDSCIIPNCGGVLMYDPGRPPAPDEPATEPAVYCPACGCEYVVDVARTT